MSAPNVTRSLVAFVLLSAYIAASVQAVRHEGSVYRARLDREQLAIRASLQPTRPTLAPPIKTVSVASETAAHPPEPRSPIPAETPLAKVDLPPRIAPPPPPASEKTESAAPPTAVDPLWKTPLMKRVWDLSQFKTEDEKQLGRELHDLILKSHAKVEVGSMPRRVEEAAEPFVAARTRKEIDYTFTVLESDAVIAFSHPGGYVYVSSGLMNWLGEDDAPSLEFVVAHEIAHVDLRHALTCLRDPGVKELGIGTIPQFLLLIFPRGYFPDRLDFEADTWAYQQMTRRDRTKRERLAFLRKLEGYAKDHGFENGRLQPDPNPDASPVENHLKAHPAPYKRLKALNDLTKLAPARAQ